MKGESSDGIEPLFCDTPTRVIPITLCPTTMRRTLMIEETRQENALERAQQDYADALKSYGDAPSGDQLQHLLEILDEIRGIEHRIKMRDRFEAISGHE